MEVRDLTLHGAGFLPNSVFIGEIKPDANITVQDLLDRYEEKFDTRPQYFYVKRTFRDSNNEQTEIYLGYYIKSNGDFITQYLHNSLAPYSINIHQSSNQNIKITIIYIKDLNQNIIGLSTYNQFTYPIDILNNKSLLSYPEYKRTSIFGILDSNISKDLKSIQIIKHLNIKNIFHHFTLKEIIKL